MKRTFLTATLILTLAAPAWAQFGSGCTPADPCPVVSLPGSVTSDQAAETSLADIDQKQLPAILQQDTTTATSLTQGGDAGVWQSNEQFLDSLGALIQQQTGLSYSDPQLIELFDELYPGYATQQQAPSPQDSVQTNLNTLNGTLQDAQAQSQNWPNEQTTLATLEANNAGVTGQLQAAQTGNEISLISVQQQQTIRQLIMALLNSYTINAAAQQQAQAASQLSAVAIIGAPPQVMALAPPSDTPLPMTGAGE
jgi:P-type conjugative transfer protein TrbJ